MQSQYGGGAPSPQRPVPPPRSGHPLRNPEAPPRHLSVPLSPSPLLIHSTVTPIPPLSDQPLSSLDETGDGRADVKTPKKKKTRLDVRRRGQLGVTWGRLRFSHWPSCRVATSQRRGVVPPPPQRTLCSQCAILAAGGACGGGWGARSKDGRSRKQSGRESCD